MKSFSDVSVTWHSPFASFSYRNPVFRFGILPVAGNTHAMRWRVFHNTVGESPLYQGRYKTLKPGTDTAGFSISRGVALGSKA